MADSGTSTRRTRIHVRDRDFTLYVKKRGLYTVLAPTGRYTETLLAAIVEEFLKRPDFLAVDLSKLDAVSLPLVRALCEYAAGLEAGQGRLVLLRPPDKIRSLIKLVGRQDKVPIALSDADLEGNPEEIEGRIRIGQERSQLIRAMLQSNPCWQLVDPESRWLCPFCATFRPDVQFAAKGSPTQRVLERISAHLSGECSTYTEGAADGWPFEVLERIAGQAAGTVEPEPPPPPPAPEASGLGEVDARRRRLLPTAAPSLPQCEAEICYRAAEVPSGDFYDFVRLANGGVALVVGDVSAAGIDAGVLMGMARKTISIRLRESDSPAVALERANDDLCGELEGESFVTAGVAVIDGERREISLVRAGLAAPFLVRNTAPRTVQRLEAAGPVLGLVPAGGFEQGMQVLTLPLTAGDVLFLHTHGLEDLPDHSGEKFGADRIAAILRANAHREASLILASVVAEAEQFAHGTTRRGDLTAVCVKIL